MFSVMNNYRVIRAPLGLVELWAHLSQYPALARQVEVVEIQRQMRGFNFDGLQPVIVPPDYRTAAQSFCANDTNAYDTFLTRYVPNALKAEKLLITAVKHMKALKSFEWAREPPLCDSRLDEGADDDIWTALKSCTALRNLRVMDASDNEIEDDPRYGHGSSTKFRPIHTSQVSMLAVYLFLYQSEFIICQIFSLSDLESLEYHTYAYNSLMKPVPVDELVNMLSYRCPRLKARMFLIPKRLN
jgi:hypothetical protein